MSKKNKHIGSDFDDFLAEEGTLKQVEAVAVKRVITFQVRDAMKKERLSKATLAKRMHTSRSALDRLFDPTNDSVTLQTLQKAASALGKKLKIQFV